MRHNKTVTHYLPQLYRRNTAEQVIRTKSTAGNSKNTQNWKNTQRSKKKVEKSDQADVHKMENITKGKQKREKNT